MKYQSYEPTLFTKSLPEIRYFGLGVWGGLLSALIYLLLDNAKVSVIVYYVNRGTGGGCQTF